GRSARIRSRATVYATNIVIWLLVFSLPGGTPSADDLRGWATPVATDPRTPLTNALAPSQRSLERAPSRPWHAPSQPRGVRHAVVRGRAQGGPARGGRRA